MKEATKINKKPKSGFPIDMSKLKDTIIDVSKVIDLKGYIESKNNGLTQDEKYISDFPEEMQECIEFDEELEKYFEFLGKLSREDLLAIVKYEIYGRLLMQQEFGNQNE